MRSCTVLLFLLGLLIGLGSYAQTRPGSLRGTIYEKSTGEPLAFVNVVVKDSAGYQVAGGVSDLDGKYNINPISVGTFTVEISSIGFSLRSIENVSTFSNLPTLLDVELEESSEVLGEVLIICERPEIITKKTCTVSCVCATYCCFYRSESPAQKRQLDLFPNPTKGSFTIKLTKEIERVALFTITRELLEVRNIYRASETSFDLNTYPTGTYIVKTISPNSVTSQKVMLTH